MFGMARTFHEVVLALLLPAVAVATTPIAATRVAPTPYRWQLPHGFPEPRVPQDNPMSAVKVELGRRLFFDSRLSIAGKYSCASCHEPRLAFTDGRALAVGATGGVLRRNAMSLVNAAYNSSYGWDSPLLRTLEQQMLTPLYNMHPVEIGLTGRDQRVLNGMRSDRSLVAQFTEAFPDATANQPAVSIRHTIYAIAAYERSLVSGGSPFDRYVFSGEHDAISADAKQGMSLFYSQRLGCGGCHSGFNFTGTWNQAAAPAAAPAFACNGVGDHPHRVPTLRNLGLTAPYMHDGRFATLEQVLSHYEHTAVRSKCADRRLRRFKLTASEREQVLAFLRTLDSRDSGESREGDHNPLLRH